MRSLSLPIIIAGLILQLVCPSEIYATASDSREKPEIPPELLYKEVNVPNEENAVLLWKSAVQSYVRSGKTEYESVLRLKKDAKFQDRLDEDLKVLESWLNRNKDCIRILDESLKRPRAQWVNMKDPEHRSESVTAFKMLIDLLEVKSMVEMDRTNFDLANGTLSQIMTMVSMAEKASDSTIFVFEAVADARKNALIYVLELSLKKDVKESMLTNLLFQLTDTTNLPAEYESAVKADFTLTDYPGQDVKKLAAKISEAAKSDEMVKIFWPESLWRPARILTDPLLVREHPMPFDEIGELRLQMDADITFMSNAVVPWLERDNHITVLQRKAVKELESDIKELMSQLEDESLPLSRMAVEKARKSYINIPDPMGRLLFCSKLVMGFSDALVFVEREQNEAVRILIAIEIFRKRTGHLPSTLADLVEEKILPRIPNDPFGTGQFLYSSERKIVWSVGYNGKDDDGDEEAEPGAVAKDYVHHIPELD